MHICNVYEKKSIILMEILRRNSKSAKMKWEGLIRPLVWHINIIDLELLFAFVRTCSSVSISATRFRLK